jgi:putative two-component system response regulator
VVGSDILSGSSAPLLQLAADIARGHHERWDGRGYPYGLKASDIPLPSRLVALADNFDALTTARPYKRAWSVDEAVSHIRANAGKQFDPACVKAFEKALPTILDIKAQLNEPSHEMHQALEAC